MIHDGGKNVTILANRINTTPGDDSDTTLLDASTLEQASGLGTERVQITEIVWTINGPTANKTLTLDWAGTPNKEIASLYGSGKWTLRNAGLPAIPNDASTPTGDILLTTTNFGAGDSYTLLLKCRKTAGYTY